MSGSTSSQAFAGISFGYNSEAIFDYRKENMCEKWRETLDKKFLLCDIKAYSNKKGNYLFKGTIKSFLKDLSLTQPIFLQFWAPNKPTRGYSFNGSGLPFPNEEVAYEDTPNKGAIIVTDLNFSFALEYPNSYYSNMGKKLNPPQINFRFCDRSGKIMSRVYTIPLGNPIPFRSLTWPQKRDWNIGPLFYDNKELLECPNQYQILINSQYPVKTMKEPKNFWGHKPPV